MHFFRFRSTTSPFFIFHFDDPYIPLFRVNGPPMRLALGLPSEQYIFLFTEASKLPFEP